MRFFHTAPGGGGDHVTFPSDVTGREQEAADTPKMRVRTPFF